MSLPGKLCIGILEEDNPLKSYFRFKPLLVEEEGRYVPFEDGQAYPEDGCIRIVPDKNESSHFKARMRRIGLFSVVDLTAHPNENDKIRPNKNYHGDTGEQNANIIYSDVVREPAPDMIYEILSGMPQDGVTAKPHTRRVLVRKDGVVEGVCYGWEPVETAAEATAEASVRLSPAEEACPIDAMQVFDIPGFRDEILHFAIKPAAMMAQVSDLPPEKAEKPAPEAREAEAAPQPAPVAAPVPAPVQPPEKPWITHDASMLPPPIDARLSPMQRLMAAQTGLNPRRGRSLQELIEDKWQQSRLNQLGHPVAPIATGDPVANPVQTAVEAVRSVWNNPDMRAPLMESLSGIEEFGITFRECREIVRKSAIEKQLNELEAQRLKILADMEQLRKGREELRSQLKQEIRRDEAADLADAVRKTEAAKARQEEFEKMAEEARSAAISAQDALDALSNGELERKLCEFANNSRILEQLERIRQRQQTADAEKDIKTGYEKISLSAFADRIAEAFAAEGWMIDKKTAANLAVCVAAGSLTLFSGPAGSGKSAAPRLAAEALGWKDGRFAAVAPGRRAPDERLKAFAGEPAMILLDDANTAPGDPMRGLADAAWKFCVTLQDTGHPVNADLLDKGFMIRLSRPACDAPWQPAEAHPRTACPPVDLSALQAEIRALAKAYAPDSLAPRMDALRRMLAEQGAALSRRALDETWYYCGAMTALLQADADPDEIFDLAVAQRILPALLAAAPIGALVAVRNAIKDMPHCQALLSQPLPVMI